MLILKVDYLFTLNLFGEHLVHDFLFQTEVTLNILKTI